jgi:hypothetical protein
MTVRAEMVDSLIVDGFGGWVLEYLFPRVNELRREPLEQTPERGQL